MSEEITKRIISSLLLLPLTFFCIIKGSYFFYFLLGLIYIIAIYEWHSLSKKRSYHFYGLFFLTVSIFTVYKLRVNSENEFWIFIIITTICILTDIGGFVFGKIFKGPKLTKYSPNKTYSGLIGGFLLPFILIPILIFIYPIHDFEMFNLTIFILIVSCASQFGDIVVSYFKRLSNVKDTGKLIPGHGGLLDRIDGMLFAFPLSYLLISNNLFNIL